MYPAKAGSRVGSSDVSFVGAFFFRPSLSDMKKIIIGHVASPFRKANRRQYAVATRVIMDEYPLEMFDNMTTTVIKSKNYFKGMNSWEQNALGMILHAARDFRRMCQTMAPERLESQEHLALADHIRQMLAKSEQEAQELAKRTMERMHSELQKIVTFNEGRLRSGPNQDEEFARRMKETPIKPAEVFNEIIDEPVEAPALVLPPILTTNPELGNPDELDKLFGRASATSFSNSPFCLLVGLGSTHTPVLNEAAAFLSFFDQTRAGNHEHVRVLPRAPVLSGVPHPCLQDPGLSGHVVACLKVHPIPLAHIIVGHEADLRADPGGRVGGDVPEGVAAVGLVEVRVGLQAVANQLHEKIAQDRLLLELPPLVFTDGVCDAGVSQKKGENIVGTLHNLETNDGISVLSPLQGNGDRWEWQGSQDGGAELLSAVEGAGHGHRHARTPGLRRGWLHFFWPSRAPVARGGAIKPGARRRGHVRERCPSCRTRCRC